MEVFSKGIHRALVPLESRVDSISAVELVDTAPSYRMLSQMDVVRFFKEHPLGLEGIMSRSVRDLGAINRTVYAITDRLLNLIHSIVRRKNLFLRYNHVSSKVTSCCCHRTKMIDAINCMRGALINAVPIVASEVDDAPESRCCLLDVAVRLCAPCLHPVI